MVKKWPGTGKSRITSLSAGKQLFKNMPHEELLFDVIYGLLNRFSQE
jgi:hypothetical protein